MNHTPESVPTVWTSADESFFHITSDVFGPDFLAGAGVLLASYDSDVPSGNHAQPAVAPPAPVAAAARATA